MPAGLHDARSIAAEVIRSASYEFAVELIEYGESDMSLEQGVLRLQATAQKPSARKAHVMSLAQAAGWHGRM